METRIGVMEEITITSHTHYWKTIYYMKHIKVIGHLQNVWVKYVHVLAYWGCLTKMKDVLFP